MNTNAKWYIIQVISNYEAKVKEALENREFDEKDSGIEEIYLPYKTIETKTGRIKKKPMFPSYLYVKVDMTDKSWYIIRNTEYVTGIVGSSGQRTKPTPITEEQILKIKQREKEEEESINTIKDFSEREDVVREVDFKEGDFVEISEGEFVNKSGNVMAISILKQTVTIEFEMFGRMTSIEVPIKFVKKV